MPKGPRGEMRPADVIGAASWSVGLRRGRSRIPATIQPKRITAGAARRGARQIAAADFKLRHYRDWRSITLALRLT